MLEKKPTTLFCEMHKKEMPCQSIWKYSAESTRDTTTPYKEEFQFCSYECLIGFLLDDEKVLKMKLHRMEVDRAVRHPHSIARAPTKVEGDPRFNEYHYTLQTEDGFGKEKVEVLRMEEMTNEQLEKEFDKEEIDALAAAYSD